MRFIVIGLRPWSGFFSNFLHTLQHLYKCSISGRIPVVYWHGGVYAKKKDSKENIWEYYFEPVSKYGIEDISFKTDDVKKTSKYRKNGFKGEPASCWDHTKRPPSVCLNGPSKDCRRHVNRLIRKNIVVTHNVMDKIDTFYEKHMSGSHVLRAHLRATLDHPENQGIKPFQHYCKYIRRYIKKHNQCKIFIATDCAKTLQKFKNQEFGRNIISYDSIRSSTGYPVQYGCQPERKLKSCGPKAGEDAVIDCLLLSKCNFMIHGISNLSACAAYFNPDMGLKFMCKYK